MRAILLFGLVGLSACNGSPGIGGSCSLDDPCGEGVCNLSGPDDPVCIESDGDIDGDGIPNKRDFCNQKAGGEFDEDGDFIGDICDPCPIAPPPARPDADGDMVDSPCDPDPTIAGEQIVVFEGFNNGLPANFRAEGTWEVRGGEAVFTDTGATMPQSLSTTVPVARHVSVQASYRVDQIAAGAGQKVAGVNTAVRLPAGTSIASCASSRVGDMDSLLFNSDAGSGMNTKVGDLFNTASLYRIAQRVDNAQAGCAIGHDKGSGAVQSTTAGDLFTEAGLTARGANVRFQYLLIVQRGDSPGQN